MPGRSATPSMGCCRSRHSTRRRSSRPAASQGGSTPHTSWSTAEPVSSRRGSALAAEARGRLQIHTPCRCPLPVDRPLGSSSGPSPRRPGCAAAATSPGFRCARSRSPLPWPPPTEDHPAARSAGRSSPRRLARSPAAAPHRPGARATACRLPRLRPASGHSWRIPGRQSPGFRFHTGLEQGPIHAGGEIHKDELPLSAGDGQLGCPGSPGEAGDAALHPAPQLLAYRPHLGWLVWT